MSSEEKEKSLDQFSEKMDKFADILEKFGMDLITKLGKVSFNINVLTDKIDNLSKATIDIKALSPQLTKIIENQNKLETEVDLIRSLLIKRGKSSVSTEEDKIERDISAINDKNSLITQMNIIKNKVDGFTESTELIDNLNTIKDAIFEFTGGHKILYEISQFINRCKKFDTINPQLREILKEKIDFWINKV
ncbi:MAG: hypothetical protein GF317_22200 [Candidatus Lokiarchaeota archaeon]|nr:hypothetical protein [Candidatus Lokiarchaeota archaeon]MBD3202173.1 hypothetical protein [Candidatus Lokiarchaeota archaeon]